MSKKEATEIFKKHFEDGKKYSAKKITNNKTINQYLKAGAKTIREIEKINPGIGGTIRYMVLQESMQPITGIYP